MKKRIPRGHYSCPHCGGEGHIPTRETIRSVQTRLLEKGYKKGELARAAGVDAAFWSKCGPQRTTTTPPMWLQLWQFLQHKATEEGVLK